MYAKIILCGDLWSLPIFMRNRKVDRNYRSAHGMIFGYISILLSFLNRFVQARRFGNIKFGPSLISHQFGQRIDVIFRHPRYATRSASSYATWERRKRFPASTLIYNVYVGVSTWIKGIIKIPESKEGFIDLNNLEQRLQENSGNGRRMIGFFAAASKLTGVLADDVATTLLLHQYGALAFWDYTLVAPYNGVDMNPTFPGVEEKMVRKDLVLFNCEKFVGGVQGPHIAVVKKDVFKDTYVYSDDVEVLSERLEDWRCVEAVRAALVMRLRDAVGVQNIADRQDCITSIREINRGDPSAKSRPAPDACVAARVGKSPRTC
ncbi:hypothetical protein EVAR_19321_1 [Eumeta japonica]|uniref:Uncharacterized protein n=1 Tax=Eumeta variegata TaxID=151549 RepID=A0A4C1TR98_EUMVA|nr:hypothetical protein EVAR_19321_1 [Eumeta japonica]